MKDLFYAIVGGIVLCGLPLLFRPTFYCSDCGKPIDECTCPPGGGAKTEETCD